MEKCCLYCFLVGFFNKNVLNKQFFQVFFVGHMFGHNKL